MGKSELRTGKREAAIVGRPGPADTSNIAAASLDPAAIRDFVLTYYRVIGARIEKNHFHHVYIDAELARNLDGPWAKAQEFHFAFGLEGEGEAPDYPAPELVGPGSMRLDEIIASVRRRKRMGVGFLDLPVPRQVILPGAILRWEPILALGVRIHRLGATTEEELYQTAVSLVSGRVYGSFPLDSLAVERLRDKPPARASIAPRRLTLKRAYRKACLDVVGALSAGDSGWAEEAAARMAREKEHLQAYFAQAVREQSATRRWKDADTAAEAALELERRLEEETLRYRPRARVRVYAAALLYALVARSPSPDGGNGPGKCVFDALESWISVGRDQLVGGGQVPLGDKLPGELAGT